MKTGLTMLLRALPIRSLAACVLAAGITASPLSAQTFTDIEVPEAGPENVFVEQIGSGNEANARQANTGQSAEVSQDGADNFVDLNQTDGGPHLARIAQDGDDNSVVVGQEGEGQVAALLTQTGDRNSASLFQRGNGLLGTAAEIVQSGSDNSVVLVQDGSDNQARLIQSGDANTMTATQLDSGNRLEWVQNGTGLADLEITQTGGAVMQVTQSNIAGGDR